ncbi:MAG: hypothetical protein JXR94_24130 [Candidatus Hydrogenedentes bacterium]|nr:hypothetical protein [Candidatus Hydrogenedentota bacterium]
MKRGITFTLALCTAVCVVAVWTSWQRDPGRDIGQVDSGAVSVELPKDTRAARVPADDEGGRLPEEVGAAIDSEQRMMAATARYARDLSKEIEEVDALIGMGADAVYEEVPPGFRFRMQPPDGAAATGRLLRYISDGVEPYLLDGHNGILDWGTFTSSVSREGASGAFRQDIAFADAGMHYFSSGGRMVAEAHPALVFEWEDTGAAQDVSAPGQQRDCFFPNLECFAGKDLKMGDTAVWREDIDGAAPAEATTTVLGSTTIDGRKTVAFEETVPVEVPGDSRRVIVTRAYCDIERCMPVRIERREITYFSDAYIREHDATGTRRPLPASGEKHIVMLYQIR